jgi:[acyl-carrier-protein] S-malonyltransferase
MSAGPGGSARPAPEPAKADPPPAGRSGAPAYLFPGQGSQVVGMADSLLESSPRARRVFERGREALGFDIERVCREGPEEELNSTRVSQPAIFLHSMALLEALSERWGAAGEFGRGLQASAACGLSLGEYSALVFAGSLAFEEGLRIVGARGRFMQEACDREPGGMVSLLGLAEEWVERIVGEARALGPIGIANYNAPSQLVISGAREPLERAVALAREAGCRRAIPLKVAGGYHSPLMASATERLAPLLKEARLRPPRIPFYPNVLGEEVRDPEAIRALLIRQVESPVRWENTMRRIALTGVEQALEVGPGRVLAGLARSIDCGLTVSSAAELPAVPHGAIPQGGTSEEPLARAAP